MRDTAQELNLALDAGDCLFWAKTSRMESPFLKALAQYDRIFLTGAGGGFDIYSGIPLFEYLKSQGKQVWLGNLSFAELMDANGQRMKRDFLKVERSQQRCVQ